MQMRTVFLTAGLVAISTLAFAATDQKREDFQSLDKNHDARLSRGEIPADKELLKARFETFDRDHNNRLDQGEYITAVRSLYPNGSDPRIYLSSSPAHDAPPPQDPIVRVPRNGN